MIMQIWNINAVVHRDYFLSGSHTVIEIFDDRMEISNPGGLPKGLTEKEFGKKAVRRNQLIASLLHRIDFVENMGTGINKIRTLLKDAGFPPPLFEFGNFYTIIFSRKIGEPLSNLLKEIKQNPYITKDELGKKLGRSRATITRQIQKLKEMLLVSGSGRTKVDIGK